MKHWMTVHVSVVVPVLIETEPWGIDEMEPPVLARETYPHVLGNDKVRDFLNTKEGESLHGDLKAIGYHAVRKVLQREGT